MHFKCYKLKTERLNDFLVKTLIKVSKAITIFTFVETDVLSAACQIEKT